MNCDPIHCWLILAAPLVILGTAIYARFYHASISAKRATVDFLVSLEANSSLTNARRAFGKSSSKGIKHLKGLLKDVSSGDASDDGWSEYANVIMYLNHCELVAVAIGSGALDETMYRNANQSQYVQAWHRCREFVDYARSVKSQQSMFEHFEALAKKWSD